VKRVARRDLLLSELAVLGAILARRDPALISVVERMDVVPLTEEERERVRRAVVDELCELPEGTSSRTALALEEILIHLGRA
jgi:hypothetical protein